MGRPKKKKAPKSSLRVKMKSQKAPPRGSIKIKLEKVVRKERKPEPVDEPMERPPKKKHPYQMYSQEDLIAAVKAVKEQGMSTYKAADLYGIPKSTVHDKVMGKSNILFQRKGPPPLLSYDDEKKLVDYLLQMSSLGYMFSIAELRNLASELAIEKGKLAEGSLLSPRWHKSFRTRWPILNEKVFGNFRTCDQKKRKEKAKNLETFEFEEEGEQIQIARMSDEADVCLSNYYTELHTLLVKYELLDKPHRIYCLDEVAIQYESGNPKAKQIKSLQYQVTSRSETTVVSLIGCGNALGQALPPFFIYPGKSLSPEMLKGKYPGVQGLVTDNGLTDYSSIRYYLEHHFKEYALLGMKKTPPVLILYDGSKSKVNPDTIAWAKSMNMVLFVLPPASDNLEHPLEKGCFRLFKDHFIRETRIFRELYNVDSISKNAICKIVSEAYPQAMSTRNLVEMFEESGIFPYKPSVVLCEDIRNERFERKNKLNAIKKRPPGMRDKGIQVSGKEDGTLKLIKSGKRKIVTQADNTVTDADSTLTFLRDKKIQKMLESKPPSRVVKRDDSEYSESEEEYELEEVVAEEIETPASQPYYLMGSNHGQSESQPAITSTRGYSRGHQGHGHDFKIEETHTYALNPSVTVSSAHTSTSVSSSATTELDSMEQTRVAVQALQDIANEIQYISMTNVQGQSSVQNVTLNSGRMIQVVVHQASGEPVIQEEQVIEEVQQIEIDNSVESIIPLPGDIIENE